ncbi:hypothetical protein HR12_10180 [Microbacterium sp. SUBG005]|nr:hypothetical protein HR12_10180 [Microbacterium sp. SUBG005]
MPNTGDRPYIPNTCRAIVTPTARVTASGATTCDKCTGVIAITEAMVTCEAATANIAKRASAGRSACGATGADAAFSRSRRWARSSGSGRSTRT